MKTVFQADPQTKLEQDSCSKDSSPEALWNKLKTAILQTSKNVLGLSTKKNKDWFDKNNHEIQDLLAKKRSAHQDHLAQPSCPMKKAAFCYTCGYLQRKLRIIQNKWWTNLAERTQHSADAGDYWCFYEALKAVYGPTHQAQSSAQCALQGAPHR